jgi:hypothetical protein
MHSTTTSNGMTESGLSNCTQADGIGEEYRKGKVQVLLFRADGNLFIPRRCNLILYDYQANRKHVRVFWSMWNPGAYGAILKKNDG